MTSFQTNRLEIHRRPRLDPELLVQPRGEIGALVLLAVVHDHPLRSRFHGPDEVQELETIRMPGEAIDRLEVHLDREREGLTPVAQGDLAGFPLDPPAEGSLRLE